MNTTPEKLTDNSLAQHQALAAFILKNAPAGLRERAVEALQRLAESGDCVGTIFLEFSRPDVTVDMSVGFSEGLGRIEDAAGDLFRAYKLAVKVTFSGHGATAPMLALRRLTLMHEVAVFALTLEREFAAPMYELSATKAERDAATAMNAHMANVEKLRAHLANSGDALKGMHVGDTRFLTIAPDVPFGTYDIIANKRTFNVVVDMSQTSVLRAV